MLVKSSEKSGFLPLHIEKAACTFTPFLNPVNPLYTALMKYLFTLLYMTFCFTVSAQDVAAPIVAEGKALYRSEMASWNGTDIFLERFKHRSSQVGGYLSYADGAVTRCIFYSGGKAPGVLATITFDSTFRVQAAQVDSQYRDFRPLERDLYAIRTAADELIRADTLFKYYKNTNLNLIPLVHGGVKKVYVLTGPTVGGVMVIGNDYLLQFDANNKLAAKKSLHRNIIPIKFNEGEDAVGSVHTHLPETGDYITATDVCTLMLYSRFGKWESHFVISENFVSVWNCKNEQLTIMTREAWDKIMKD
jgi:hypothetical protein